MREIVLKRLVEIRESLLEIKPKLKPGTEIFKEVQQSLSEINNALKGYDLSKLPRDVRIDSSQLKFDGNMLKGRVLLTDNRNVYDIQLGSGGRVVSCNSSEGGVPKLEWLSMQSSRK